MIYFILSGWLAFSAFFKNNNLYRLNLGLVWVFFGFAYGFNYDWINYFKLYEGLSIDSPLASYLSVAHLYEPGFVFFCFIFKYLNLDYQWMVASTIFLVLLIFNKFNSRLQNKNLGFFIFYGLAGFTLLGEQLRQALAFSIICYSTVFLDQKKCLRFYLLILIAMSFHVSAVFAVIFPIFNLLFRHKNKILLSIISILLVCTIPLFFYIFKHPQLLSFIPFIYKKFMQYYVNESIIFRFGLFGFLFNLAFLGTFLFWYSRRGLSAYLQQGILAILFSIVSRVFGTILTRFTYYSNIYIIKALDSRFNNQAQFTGLKILVISALWVNTFSYLQQSRFLDSVLDYQSYITSDSSRNELIKISCHNYLKQDPDNEEALVRCTNQ